MRVHNPEKADHHHGLAPRGWQPAELAPPVTPVGKKENEWKEANEVGWVTGTKCASRLRPIWVDRIMMCPLV